MGSTSTFAFVFGILGEQERKKVEYDLCVSYVKYDKKMGNISLLI